MATRNADYMYNNNGVWDKLNLSTIADQVSIGSKNLANYHTTDKMIGVKLSADVIKGGEFVFGFNAAIDAKHDTSNTYGALQSDGSIKILKEGIYMCTYTVGISDNAGANPNPYDFLLRCKRGQGEMHLTSHFAISRVGWCSDALSILGYFLVNDYVLLRSVPNGANTVRFGKDHTNLRIYPLAFA